MNKIESQIFRDFEYGMIISYVLEFQHLLILQKLYKLKSCKTITCKTHENTS